MKTLIQEFQKQSLKELESEGVKYVVVRIDETEFWKPSIARKAKRIDGIYLIDLTQPTNLCSFDVNFPAELIKNFLHNTDKFNEDEEFDLERENVSDTYPYFLERDKFEVVKKYMDGELEEALENEQCNPSVC